ncbi:2-oxo acid dehydrogenase subunit E2 [Streptomyces sp. NPDC059544]|uniref:2-oxo acid dehydrogenase subunit E2 n=1 Tax=Streptomyces sp. NPDC059544 TaxID=3346861 RepID=UPI0036BBF562
MPELNGHWVDGGFVPGDGVHLGVAVSLRGGGLVAPALHDADTLDVRQLMAGLKDLVARARTGRLRGSEVSAPTLTVTNLGDQGVETVYGVIYPPQVALVGFGRVGDRPSAVDGLLGVRPVVTATLSADHRATDGAVGARYLTAVDRLLRNPEQLVNRTEALELVKDSISRVVPGADFDALGPDDSFRDALEMDSLDFLGFVEALGDRSGVRIEDEDTPQLTTLSGTADFLVARAG